MALQCGCGARFVGEPLDEIPQRRIDRRVVELALDEHERRWPLL